MNVYGSYAISICLGEDSSFKQKTVKKKLQKACLNGSLFLQDCTVHRIIE